MSVRVLCACVRVLCVYIYAHVCACVCEWVFVWVLCVCLCVCACVWTTSSFCWLVMMWQEKTGFIYHWSWVAASWKLDEKRISNASKTFGALMILKRYVYKTCVLCILLIKLDCSPHRSLKSNSGIASIQQCKDCIISSVQQSGKETMDSKLRQYHLEQLGYLSRMTNYRFSIICLLAGCLIPIYFVDPEDKEQTSQIVV